VSVPEGLLHTIVGLALPSLTDPAVLPEVALISTVTLAELSVGPLVASDDLERARRLGTLQQAEADFDPLPFDAAAARAFGQVAASYRRSGRKPAARSLAAMIAATALANGLPLKHRQRGRLRRDRPSRRAPGLRDPPRG
jgi:hypothetical protein